MQNLHITLIQLDITWQDVQANIDQVSASLANASDTDIIVLPEMWTTGFSMEPKHIATMMDGEEVKQMQTWATTYSAIIIGSIIIKDSDQYKNRMLVVGKEGIITYYDKRHLFTLAGEHEVYTPGEDRVIFSYKGWKICLNVCYDLRFPVWSRNDSQYDALLYVANWPSSRHQAWRILLQARAIENQCYVIGCNRIGKDDNGLEYHGGSTIIDYTGNHIIELDKDQTIGDTDIDKISLKKFRKKLNFLSDRDDFMIL